MVEVSLKQARRLDSAVQTAIDLAISKALRQEGESFPSKAEGDSVVSAALEEALDGVLELVTVRFVLRSAVDAKNAQVGINQLCGQIAELEEQLRVLKNFAAPVNFRYSLGKENSVYGTSYPDYSHVTTKLQFQISELKDRCTGLNSQTKISLPETVVDVLKGLGVPM
jgi:hypothetical protein